MKQEEYLDILETMSSKRNQRILATDLRGKLFRKYLILENFLKGRAGLIKSFLALMPDFLKSQNNTREQVNILDAEIILRDIFGKSVLTPVSLFSYKLYYSPQESITATEKYLYFFGLIQLIKQIILKDQYRAGEFIKDNFTIIDAGANIGIFSLFVHHLAPDAKIYAFEPAPKIFDILNRTVVTNKLSDRIHIFQQALGNRKCRVKFMTSMAFNDPLATGSIVADSEFSKNRQEIFYQSVITPMTTIDNFVEEHKIDKVDFIKIDTEGYEKQILVGAEKTIKTFRPIISCSAYHLKEDKTEIPQLIKSFVPRYNFTLGEKAEEVFLSRVI